MATYRALRNGGVLHIPSGTVFGPSSTMWSDYTQSRVAGEDIEYEPDQPSLPVIIVTNDLYSHSSALTSQADRQIRRMLKRDPLAAVLMMEGLM